MAFSFRGSGVGWWWWQELAGCMPSLPRKRGGSEWRLSGVVFISWHSYLGRDFPADAWVLGEVLALGSFPRDCMGAGETKEGTKKKLRLTRRDELWEGHPADHRAPQEGPSEPGGKELRGWVRGGPSPQPCVVCTALFVLIGKATFWPLLETVFFASPGPLALTVDCILVRKSVVHFNSC